MTLHARLTVLAVLAAFAGAAGAQSAKWDGFYLGAQGGSAWAKSTWNTSAFLLTSTDEHIENKARDWALGAQLGYWHRVGSPWLLGAELSALKTELTGDSGSPLPGVSNRLRRSTVRDPWVLWGQVGYSAERWLGYGKFGYARAKVDLQADNQNPGGITMSWTGGKASGAALGAGVAYSLAQHLAVGIDYEYVKLKMGDVSGFNSGGFYVKATEFQSTINLLLLRLNYTF